MNTQNREPNIRFNQFKELWKVVKLDSISKKVKSKNLNNTFENVLTNSAEFGIIPQRDFFDKDIANLKSLNGYYVVQPNDFVYNPRISNKAPVGPIKANFLNTTGVMSPLYYVFRTQNIDVFFLAKYFDSSYWHKFMKLNGDTGARSDRFAIKDSVFKEMPIPFPSHSEQSAIGSLFCTIDDLLASYKDNLANYQSLKATMLSKMFPKAGQTVPEIRLDGFEGEWKFSSLGEQADITKLAGFEFTNHVVYSDEGEIPAIRGLNVKNQKVNLSDVKYIDKSDFSKLDRSKLIEDDLLFTYVGTVGEVARVPESVLWYLAPNVSRIRLNMALDSRFVLYQMASNRFKQKQISPLIATSSQPALSMANIRKFIISFTTLEEQQAIGTYFSNLDKLINSHQEKISQLETLKKKLLQDMFI